MGVAQGNARPPVAIRHANITHRHTCPHTVSKSLTKQLVPAATTTKKPDQDGYA